MRPFLTLSFYTIKQRCYMKPKLIFIIWILATIIGLTGVAMFVNGGEETKNISRMLMVAGLILSAAWFIGLITLIGKKVFGRI